MIGEVLLYLEKVHPRKNNNKWQSSDAEVAAISSAKTYANVELHYSRQWG